MTAFCTADYVLCAVTIAAAIFGLFGGFSGALGFCGGVVAAGATVRFGHGLAATFLETDWAAALATLVLALFAFGIARTVIRRVVKGLLAQPADAIFGSLVAAVTGISVALAAIYAAKRAMNVDIESTFYQLVMEHIG